MNNFNLDNFLKGVKIILHISGKKTFSVEAVEATFAIMYMNHDLKEFAEINANKYLDNYTNHNARINNFKHNEKIVRNFFTDQVNLYSMGNYRISLDAIVYICGLADTFNDQIQVFG